MNELKLYGMRAGFDEIAGKGLARREDIYSLVARPIRAEHITVRRAPVSAPRRSCGAIVASAA